MPNKDDFSTLANERYQKSREFWRNWRAQAIDDYAFVSGDQWTQEDEAKLKSEDRPSITFNYSEKMIDAVIGAEISNRQEVHYAPQGVEDAALAELWNAAAKWAREQCNAEDEESDAFRDALVCGLGWTWTRLSYDEDLDGKIVVERVDPLEMFADPAASKPGLKDRRYQDRLWWVDEREVKRQWPDAIFSVEDDDAHTGIINRGNRYAEDSTMDDRDRHKGQVQLRLHETFEMEDVYRVATPTGLQEMDAAGFKQLPEKPADGMFAKQRKRVYYRAYFAGETLLELKKSPCQVGFCFQAITAKRDRNRNVWYGLTRVMKDPQRWGNKWLSQILHIINSNAKGGLMAEIGAFVDPTKAQEEWASPDSITLLNEGGLGKVEQKESPSYPAGLDKLMGFALNSLPMVTGINLEALGLANRDQAGVVESQRKQAAYGILAPIFDGQRRYRKEQGRVLLDYIHNYISDGRMVRIGGPDSQQFLPLTKAPDAPKYDIIVDQSPNAPDTKQKTWESLVELIPSLLKANIPLPPDLLDYTPLPTALVTKWKAFVKEQQAQGQQQSEEMQKLQQELQAAKQNQDVQMAKLQFDQKRAVVELNMEREKFAAQMQMEREQMQEKIRLEREKAHLDMELKVAGLQQDQKLAQTAQDHDMKMKQQQVNNDYVSSVAANVGKDGASPEFPRLLEKLANSGSDMQQQTADNSKAIADALQALTTAIARPKKLTFDAKGMPVGVESISPTLQ